MDFGATRFRVVMLKLAEGNEIVQEAVRYFHAPEVVRIGTGEQLFDFLAGCVEEFIRKENIDASQVLPMGKLQASL
jgi:hexokinase